MFENVFTVDIELIKQVPWNDDSQEYDLLLSELGSEHEYCLIQNPYSENLKYLHYANFEIDNEDKRCLVFNYQGEWLGKVFSKDWIPDFGYVEIELEKPEYVWIKNQNLDRLMTFEDNPFGEFEPEPWDSHYKLIWYIDPKFNPLPDKVWALSCTPFGMTIKGEKDMGYISPEMSVEINEEIPYLGIDVEDCYPPYYLLTEECVWFLDSNYTDEPVWVYKFKPTYRKTTTYIDCGEIGPNFQIEYNPALGELNYDLDYEFTLDDIQYEHVWYLDRQHLDLDEEDIWAFKVSVPGLAEETRIMGYVSPTPTVEQNYVLGPIEFQVNSNIHHRDFDKENVWLLDRKHQVEEDMWCVKLKYIDEPSDTKIVSYISPRHYFEYNPALPKLEFDVNYNIPWYDFKYIHKWTLDPAFFNNNEKVWAVNLFLTTESEGEKEIGYITPVIKDKLDVIFISYYEPNAEENWQRVLEKAPWAKRVDGVEGIFAAHKQAALLSETDMFYVVDGDAWLVDNWQFDYQPGIFDRDCAYVWHSLNPVNGLEYGYGGVKLFSKSMMINAKSMTKLDMTTSVMPKLKVIEKVSNETRFDTDKFSTWRSAFRECVKLCYSNHLDPQNTDTNKRLKQWLVSSKGKFAKFAKKGANDAVTYVKNNFDNYTLLLNINDRDWLEKEFRK
jgi:hypothetical protein